MLVLEQTTMTTYLQTVVDGNITGSMRLAVVTGSLWAIGSSWSYSVREIVITILPVDTNYGKVLAELFAALLTTLLGVCLAFLAVWCIRPVTTASARTSRSLRMLRYRDQSRQSSVTQKTKTQTRSKKESHLPQTSRSEK